jgi:hypothetical protein
MRRQGNLLAIDTERLAQACKVENSNLHCLGCLVMTANQSRPENGRNRT